MPTNFATPELQSLMALLQRRHSCRAFLSRQVDDDLIRQLLEVARHTASWCNAQPWQIAVTRGVATESFRQVYSQWAAGHEPEPDYAFPVEYVGVYRERRRECGWRLYESVGIERGDREASARQGARNFEFFGAPHVAIVTTDAQLGVYGALDCSAWVANFMLAATAAGIACIAQAALACHPQLIRQHFGLPESRRVVCGVSFGYEDTQHPANGFRTSRAAIDETVSWF